MKPIEVKTARSFAVRMAIVVVLPVFVGISVIVGALDNLRAAVNRTGLAMGLLMAIVPILIISTQRRRWVWLIDDTGVRLRTGRLLPWSDWKGVRIVHVHTKYGPGAGINHYELTFTGGAARVFPIVTANADEVMALVHALEAGKRPWLPEPPPAAQRPEAPAPAAAPAPTLGPAPAAAPASAVVEASSPVLRAAAWTPSWPELNQLATPAPAEDAAYARNHALGSWTVCGLHIDIGYAPLDHEQPAVFASSPAREGLWMRRLYYEYMLVRGIADVREEAGAIRIAIDAEHAKGGESITCVFVLSTSGELLDARQV